MCKLSNTEKPGNIKKNCATYHKLEEDDSWKVPFINDIIGLRSGVLDINFDESLLTIIHNFTLTSRDINF